jgi:hypothetical protein
MKIVIDMPAGKNKEALEKAVSEKIRGEVGEVDSPKFKRANPERAQRLATVLESQKF